MKINENFLKRQQKLLKKLGKTGIAIIFAAKEEQPSNSDFYYLTGFPEAGAIAVFIPNRAAGEYILFSRERNPQTEVWSGPIIGQEAACREYGAAQAFPISNATTMLAELIQNREQIYTNFTNKPEFTDLITPTELINIGKIVHKMRLLKDSYEIEAIKQACKITNIAIRRAIQACKPAMYEHELAAEIEYEFIKHGSYDKSFPSIVASGPNSCVLHHEKGKREIQDGEVVLLDVGTTWQNYCSDISRTFPANGRFNPEQRAIYQAVLDAQTAVITAIKPGLPWNELQNIATSNITQSLIDLGLLQGELEQLLDQQAYKPFYMHNVSHWLGLDAHDVGHYKVEDSWRTLEPGMVLTVEPGIYISANLPNIATKWWNIGVRIEDDILVTNDGCEVLSGDIPRTTTDIEEIFVG